MKPLLGCKEKYDEFEIKSFLSLLNLIIKFSSSCGNDIDCQYNGKYKKKAILSLEMKDNRE